MKSGTLGPPELTPSNWPDGLPGEIPPFGPFGESSLFSRTCSPSKLGASNAFDESVEGSVPELAKEFDDSSTLLPGLRGSKIAPGKTTPLIIEAEISRARSANSAKKSIKHVKNLIHFYLDTSNKSAATLNGEGAVALLRDFLESLKGRGRTAPSDAKHPLTVLADALGIDWPLTNPLVLSAATVEINEGPRQDPAMDVETERKPDEAASNVEILISKRASAAGILLMAYASLRFAGVKKIRSRSLCQRRLNTRHPLDVYDKENTACFGRGHAHVWGLLSAPPGYSRCWSSALLTRW